MKKIAIFGTSGFAHEVADVAHAMGYEDIVFLTHLKSELKDFTSFPVLLESEVEELKKKGYCFAIGCGDPKTRKRIYSSYKSLTYPNLIHPSAVFGINQRQVLESGKGNIVAAGAAFMSGIQVGDFSVFSLNATVGHDCIVSDFVSVMPGVNISGNVLLEEGAYMGVSSTTLQGEPDKKLCIGSYSIVGAAALVTKSVNKGSTVVGIPAKHINEK